MMPVPSMRAELTSSATRVTKIMTQGRYFTGKRTMKKLTELFLFSRAVQ